MWKTTSCCDFVSIHITNDMNRTSVFCICNWWYLAHVILINFTKLQKIDHAGSGVTKSRLSVATIDGLINSLRLSDAIWRHRSESTSAQVMACCLSAPSHYLNQCWLIIIHLMAILQEIHQSSVPMRKKMATVTAHRELTVTKMVTASHDWAMTWAVIELWPSRDWVVIILKMPWLSCDLAVTELWPNRDWALTSPWLSCDLS